MSQVEQQPRADPSARILRVIAIALGLVVLVVLVVLLVVVLLTTPVSYGGGPD